MTSPEERAEKAYPPPANLEASITAREQSLRRQGYARGWKECAEEYESEVFER